jgi:3',5'-cyclic AMP phosphodiesterase CpdA
VSRRALAAAGVLAVVLAASVLAAVHRRPESLSRAAGGSTLVGTWIDSDGNGTLEPGPGEPFVDRTDLAPSSPAVRTLATFVQVTDTHVRDEESPARASLLDRLDPDLNSAFRPQEALSPQVLGAILASIDAMKPDAVVMTGDLIDSDQKNELDQFLATVDGGEVDPDTGGPGYEGPQQASNPDPFFYRPDLDAPRHPGLLSEAEKPFDSPGIAPPWFPIVGNHDVLVQGEVPSTAALDELATGDRLLTGLRRNLDPSVASRGPRSPGIDLPDESALTPHLVDRVIGHGLPGPTEEVTADPGRRHLAPSAVVARLRAASGTGGSGPLMDYSFDIGPRVRVIAVDLVNRAGGSGGVVSAGQPRWLRGQIAAAGDRTVIVMTHQPIDGASGGSGIVRVLDHAPSVVATIAGDTHRNSIDPRPTPGGGYWEIQTSSLADYPQQARAVSVVATADGGVALETWMIDGTGSELADTARDLSYLDAQGGRPQGDAGETADRNARLYR